jgi:hypothetical protein
VVNEHVKNVKENEESVDPWEFFFSLPEVERSALILRRCTYQYCMRSIE